MARADDHTYQGTVLARTDDNSATASVGGNAIFALSPMKHLLINKSQLLQKDANPDCFPTVRVSLWNECTMRRTAGLVRQNAAAPWCTCARMLLMAGDDPLRFLSFWRLQIIGGVCLYVVVLVACIPDVVKRPGVLRGTSCLLVFTILGSFVCHQIYLYLLCH